MNFYTKLGLGATVLIVIILLILWATGYFNKKELARSTTNLSDFTAEGLGIPYSWGDSEGNIIYAANIVGQLNNPTIELILIERVRDQLWNYAQAQDEEFGGNGGFTVPQRNLFTTYLRQGGIGSHQMATFESFQVADFAEGGPADNWNPVYGTQEPEELNLLLSMPPAGGGGVGGGGGLSGGALEQVTNTGAENLNQTGTGVITTGGGGAGGGSPTSDANPAQILAGAAAADAASRDALIQTMGENSILLRGMTRSDAFTNLRESVRQLRREVDLPLGPCMRMDVGAVTYASVSEADCTALSTNPVLIKGNYEIDIGASLAVQGEASWGVPQQAGDNQKVTVKAAYCCPTPTDAVQADQAMSNLFNERKALAIRMKSAGRVAARAIEQAAASAATAPRPFPTQISGVI